jgi:sporulation protein YlmC with PRC-barrel domain
MIQGSDLQGKMVRDEAGASLGRLNELHIRDGVVTILVCGPTGFLQRLMPSRRGRRIPWSAVKAVEAHQIVVTTDRRP